jgi:hypothetical protein
MAALGGNIVLFGGADANGQLLGDTWTFNGASWTEVSPSVSPPARTGAHMATANAKVVLFGGEHGQPCPQCQYYGDTWVFDGVTWTEQSVSGPTARASGTMTTLTGGAFLFGGYGGALDNDAWIWNGASWTANPLGPAGRLWTAAAAPGGPVVLFGGWNGAVLSDTWIFAGGSWTSPSPGSVPPPRWGHAMAAIP